MTSFCLHVLMNDVSGRLLEGLCVSVEGGLSRSPARKMASKELLPSVTK